MKEKNDTYVTIETLKNMFKTVKEEYQKKFIEMYDFDLKTSYWIGNVLVSSDYYFDFYDVKYAVDNDIIFEILDKWYDYSLIVYENFNDKVSLEEYKTGMLPYEEEDIIELRKLQGDFDKAKSALDDLLYKLKNGNQRN